MTVFGRDASNFDSSVSYAGLGFLTHKATEGTSVVHDKYGGRLFAARAAGVSVLGAYHVLRTPGSGGAGSLAQQLAFWLGYLDGHTPWWRDHPHFMLQVDAERWPYDNVQPATVLDFAGLLVDSGVPAYKVTYASRGQYGDSLRGIRTPLWNADYRGSSGGSYPGDGWVSSKGQAAGWAPYSGRIPMFLQYTSTPYDMDAFPGDLASLLATVGGTKGSTMTLAPNELDLLQQDNKVLGDAYAASKAAGDDPVKSIGTQVAELYDALVRHPAGSVTLTDEQMAALTARVDAGLAAIGTRLDDRFAKLEQAIGQALGAAATVLETPQG